MGKWIFVAGLTAVLLSACSSPEIMRVSETMVVRDYTPQPAVSQPEAVEIRVVDVSREVEKEEQKVSLTVKDSELVDVLFLLSRDSRMPIIADKDVHGKVTADIQKRSVMEILSAIVKPLGYIAFIEDDVIRVGQPRLVSKTFYVDFIRGSRDSTSTMNAAISTSQGGQTTAQQGVITTSQGSVSSSGVKVSTEMRSNFWREITRGLELLIFGESGSGPEGASGKADKTGKKLILNEQSGLIYVRDYADNLVVVQSFLESAEEAAKRQVMIQAHIIEVSLNDNFTFGLDWNLILGSKIGDAGRFSLSQGLMPVNPSKVLQLGYQIARTNQQFDLLLDAMKDQGKINVLSSPKISSLNNQKALIKLTTKAVSWITKTTVTGNPPVIETSNTPQVDEVGIFLDVTPQIDDSGMITMQIHPSISDISKQSVSPDGKSNMPVIDVREVDTIVHVQTGQTIVIAGLIVDKVTETKRSIPFLGDIPGLGTVFTSIIQQKQKTELVILLTPYLLNAKTIDEIAREHEKRLKGSLKSFTSIPGKD